MLVLVCARHAGVGMHRVARVNPCQTRVARGGPWCVARVNPRQTRVGPCRAARVNPCQTRVA
eukprot:10939622-Alexandrium_andersonii.AAC.1